VPADLGAVRKEKAMAEEAVAACQDALVIFPDRNMDDLTAGSEKNHAEALALLAALHRRSDFPREPGDCNDA